MDDVMTVETTNVLMDLALAKLTKMFGQPKGQVVADEVLSQMGKNSIETPDDMKRFADNLISRGGLAKMIGHTIMMEALLRGAKP